MKDRKLKISRWKKIIPPQKELVKLYHRKDTKPLNTDKEENLIIISEYIRLNIKITKISFNIASKYLSKNLQNSKEKQTNP